MPQASPAQPHPRKKTENAMWKEIDDLARAYYADKSNLQKRQALYDALMKERYDEQKDPNTGEMVLKRMGSALKQLARDIVELQKKGNLGSSVTVLTEELVQDALMREDVYENTVNGRRVKTQTGRYWWQATVLFGRAEDGVDGRYDPEKSAIQTWFSKILRNLFTDQCRSINSERKHMVNIDDWRSDDSDDSGKDDLTLEMISNWLPPESSAELLMEKKQIGKVLQGQSERVQEVGMAIALSKWTKETDQDIQGRLGVSRDQFRYAQEKANTVLLSPKVEQVRKALELQSPRVQDVGLALAIAPLTNRSDNDVQKASGLNDKEFKDTKDSALPLIRPLWLEWLDEHA